MSEEAKVDERVEYLRGRIQVAFKHLKADRIEKGFSAQESMYVVRPLWLAQCLGWRRGFLVGAVFTRSSVLLPLATVHFVLQ
jgi:hypothetical protein